MALIRILIECPAHWLPFQPGDNDRAMVLIEKMSIHEVIIFLRLRVVSTTPFPAKTVRRDRSWFAAFSEEGEEGLA
jgi:hypothetical protein